MKKWDIEYIADGGKVIETINYKNVIDFEKEIRESYGMGRPINFKYVEGMKEIER